MEEKWRERMDRDRSLRGGHGRGKGGGVMWIEEGEDHFTFSSVGSNMMKHLLGNFRRFATVLSFFFKTRYIHF